MLNGWRCKLTLSAAAALFCSTSACATDLVAEGNKEYRLGHYDVARAYYREAAASNPLSYQLHYQIGNASMNVRDYVAAQGSYAFCLKLNPSADVKTQCYRALAFIKSELNQPDAPVTPARMHVPTQNYNSAFSTTPKSDAELQKEKTKEHIKRLADAELAKLKEEENERWQQLMSQTNRLYKYSDGTVRRDLSNEEKLQFLKEYEQKARVIHDRAQRNIDAIK
jgi:hypothetical protein